MTNYRIEGQCEHCDKIMVECVLGFDMMEYVNVCEDCFQRIFRDVANEGVEYFYEWATEMYGIEKAMNLSEQIYGQQSLKLLGINTFDGEMMTMWTYGILKYRKNIEREGGQNIVEHSTISGHKIYLYNNSFPVTQMTGRPDDIVYGTLFDVPKYMVLHQYDRIEGYNPNAHPNQNMYNRIEVEVTTPNGEKKLAQMYYANQRMFAKDINKRNYIPTGNFDDRHLAKSYTTSKYKY